MDKKKKRLIIACCFIVPIPFIVAVRVVKKLRGKKQYKQIEKKARGKLIDLDFFNKFSRNSLAETRLKLNKEVAAALLELKTKTFEKIYEMQQTPMREEERETFVKEYLQAEILKNELLKNYLDDGIINADFIALHPNILIERAKKLFKATGIKGYLLYNVDMTHPDFTIKPMPYLNRIYVTKDTKELFLLDHTIGTHNGLPMWHVVRGFPFSMEMEYCVEEIQDEFKKLAQTDKRFALRRVGLDSHDIAAKFASIELQKELGYSIPRVKLGAMMLVVAIMSALITAMVFMIHITELTIRLETGG